MYIWDGISSPAGGGGLDLLKEQLVTEVQYNLQHLCYSH